MQQNELLTSLHWRYATKHFNQNKKIDFKTLKTLKEALVLSPSSFGLQPYKFFIISDIELRKKLSAASWNQAQITECSHLIVFVGKKTIDKKYIEDFIELTANTRKMPLGALDDYKSMMLGALLNSDKNIPAWAGEQAYIALGNLLTSAAVLGIDACPMEGIDPLEYDKILGIDENHGTLCVCALGYRTADDKYQNLAKVRLSEDKLIKEI